MTVTPDEPPVNLYGFIWAQFADDTEGYYREPNTWGSFTDTNPKDAKILGQMPAGDGVQEGTVVLCAELVGDTVYGYTKGGYFFTMDFEAMEQGTLGNVEYKRVNVTGYEDFYPTEMAYDYSTGTMYIINMLGVLYEVDLETGDLDLDSARVLDGVLPGAPSGASDYACGFAIDLDGNAYIMIVGIGMSYGGNGLLPAGEIGSGDRRVYGRWSDHSGVLSGAVHVLRPQLRAALLVPVQHNLRCELRSALHRGYRDGGAHRLWPDYGVWRRGSGYVHPHLRTFRVDCRGG